MLDQQALRIRIVQRVVGLLLLRLPVGEGLLLPGAPGCLRELVLAGGGIDARDDLDVRRARAAQDKAVAGQALRREFPERRWTSAQAFTGRTAMAT
jgi:hypothetical protein